ncbi:MAG: ATP-binding protein, partial [Gammaproteobacteria bacterium]|nr:ATP-binding protein [Gammaproteobacteria bacterium]
MPRPPPLDKLFVNPSQRMFTDRDEPQALFQQALTEVNNRDHSILCFYGVGGIGKSRLITHLKEQHLDEDDNCLYSSVDFDNVKYQKPHQALSRLVQNFKNQPFKIPFPSFTLAYLIYWEKAYPDVEIKKSSLPFLEEGGVIADGLAVVTENTGAIGSIALRVLEYSFKKKQQYTFDENIKANLQALTSLDSEEEIEQHLHQFFAYDIQRYKEKHPSRKIVLFLDTYEALWKDTGYKQHNQLTQDAWIRNGLVSSTKEVLFVICGREKS